MSTFAQLKKKAQTLAASHQTQIRDGIDKAAVFANTRTKGKHASKIASVASKADQVTRKAAAAGRAL